jgi:hypothetical protein
MSERQEDEFDVLTALLVIRNGPPKRKEPDKDGWIEFEPYDNLHAVETISRAMKECPDLVARMVALKPYDRAVLTGRSVALLLRNKLGREPTKGEIIREMEGHYPEERRAISKSDPIPTSTATRYFKACRLSHLDQDRSW